MDWNEARYDRVSDGEIIRGFVTGSWFTRTLLNIPVIGKIMSNRVIYSMYLQIGSIYLRKATLIADLVELSLFTASVLLVNNGYIWYGVVIGVLGIVVSSNIENHYLKLETQRSAEDITVEFYERMAQQERIQNSRS